MRVAGLALLVALAAACSGPERGAVPAGSAAASQPWERDPYTQTSTIEIDGNPVGYLVEYQPIPAGVDVQRVLPAGSYRIQAKDFEDIGFITKRGELRRYAPGGSTSLGTWSLEDGLLQFFHGERRVKLAVLEPRPPKAPAPATPPAEGEKSADDGTAATGDEPAMDGEKGGTKDGN